MDEMRELFLTYHLTRLKHLVFLLKQTPEGWPLPELIAEYNARREFLRVSGKEQEADAIVNEHGSEWVKGLR